MTEISTYPTLYDTDYYLNEDGTPRPGFGFDDVRTVQRAEAMLQAAQVPAGGSVLDFGCGIAGLTLGFRRAGADAVGVDTSPYAIENALPEARPYVQTLGHAGLSVYGINKFDLVILKDVIEHVRKEKIPDLIRELSRIARRQLFIIPTTNEQGSFIFPPYNDDPTHVTRLTATAWPQLIAQGGVSVEPKPDLTPQIRRPDKVRGTISVLAA